MAIEVSRQTAYGGDLVTEKYKPLNVQYTPGEKDIYSRLLTHRSELLTAARLLPQPLALRTDWTEAIKAERTTGQLPPLVVISSNRSQWMASGIATCSEQLRHVRFSVAHDLNALTDKGSVGQAPPLYSPQRIGSKRSVYILVHLYEYENYKKAFAESEITGVTVVSWNFNRPLGSPIGQLTGFGASRFAAIEFCKELRKESGQPWDHAWLLDDNVVGFTSWPGFAAFESVMKAAPTRVCAGFRGGTLAEPHADIVRWAAAEVKKGRALPTTMPAAVPTGGLVQQASLWNIKHLADNHLNFGPAFINSAEDVSLSKYLDLTGTPYFFYEGAKVVKEATKGREDGSTEAGKVNAARDAYTKWVVDAEAAAVAGNTPPPPVQVKLKGGDAVTLKKFITDWFTSTTPPPATDANKAKVQEKAMCHGVEQIVAEALGRGRDFFNVDALTANVKVNGSRPQEVARINLK